MKNIFISIFALLSLMSCNGLLDAEPTAEQTESQFYRSEKDAFQALVAAYDLLQWDTFELYSEVISDNCYGGGGSANDVPYLIKMSRWQMDPADPNIDIIWSKFYSGIFRANILLEKIDDIPFNQQSDKDRMIAECHFLRAYYYWGLVRCFGNVPLILKTLAKDEFYTQEQAKPEDVYVQIKKDLIAAIDGGLPAHSAITPKEKGRISKHAAEALLVRVYMYYTGVYSKTDLDGLTKANAVTYIKDVIGTSGSDLLPNYADVFKVSNKNHNESIFDIQYSNKSTWGDWGYLQGSDGNFAIIRWGIREPEKSSPYSSGWSFAPVRASLYTDYNEADKRRDVTVVNMEASGWSYKAGYQNTGIFNNKYTTLKENDPKDGSRELNYPNNQIVIRYSDILLMAAELLLDSEPEIAQNYYGKVVRRAMGANFNVPTVTKEFIMKERKLEFALEGLRYWDLRRNGLEYTKAAIEADNANVSAEFKKTFDVKYQGLMPIPQSQILQCKLFKQNQGYL